jgi:predicted membrane-bound spermidine synthase
MHAKNNVNKSVYAGLFVVTLATLMYEILLTRIFSVTMWYHFAFLAISIAMFGMTAGALLVYLRPHFFTPARVHGHLAWSSLLFSVTVVLSFLAHLALPFSFDITVRGVTSLALTYIAVTIPFVFSGICVCLALTRFPENVSKLYAADLAGAAVGCILFKFTLDLTDGPTAVIVVAFLASSGATLFAHNVSKGLRTACLAFGLAFFIFSAVHTGMVWNQSPLIKVTWEKGVKAEKTLYEKWNSFSRIAVRGNPNVPQLPHGWGLSPRYPAPAFPIPQLFLNIDASAGTYLTNFDGRMHRIEFLKYDIVNLAHYIRQNADVLAVGVGGGRDILSALVFDQKSVQGVEINKAILDAVNGTFGPFTGHLDKHPKVTFINDEARSYIARQKRKFDIIQVSLIDTWAATAAGAFVLTENSLYTIEAWKVFLERLSPGGVLTFSRWYFRDNPGETYRLASLATAALLEIGVENPRDHMLIARSLTGRAGFAYPNGIGTIIVSNKPLSKADLSILESTVENLQFEIVQSPTFSMDDVFASITSGTGLHTFVKSYPINIAPPTDDSPFFFHMLRLKDIFNRKVMAQGLMTFNMKAVATLGILLIIVVTLTFTCIVLPLLLTSARGKAVRGTSPLLLFFASIGFGFILVEISQLQRLAVFLGHPTYSLTVVLFSLLLSSGIGSYLTQRVGRQGFQRVAYTYLFALLFVLLLFGVSTPSAINFFQSSVTPVRIVVAVAILFPLGLFMGMPFPLGMKVASAKAEHLTPWFWGINGATSVCGSVLAVAIALNSGISVSFWTGFLCYLVAFLALVRACRKTGRAASAET